jgi:ATP-binding cassette, subfamily C (CFTR/MRP), member 1
MFFSDSVDPATQSRIKRSIKEAFSDCTLIVIAHQLDSILDFDRIAVFGDGKLLEFDSPRKLLGMHSQFRALMDAYQGKSPGMKRI